MKQEIKDLWIPVLLSGKYIQAEKRLRKNIENCEGYCCLGVLCDLYKEQTGKGRWEVNAAFGDYTFFDENNDSSKTVLPEAVKKWAGFGSNNPQIEKETLNICLANMNDQGKSFEEIVEAIKEYF